MTNGSDGASIAIAMAVRNRKTQTLQTIEALYGQTNALLIATIIVVDDGSTDGTGEEIARLYPDVRVIRGDGSLYWNGAMRLAIRAAEDVRPTHVLLMNDDGCLRPDAIEQLVSCAARHPEGTIVVGALDDVAEPGVQIYGGVNSTSAVWFRPRIAAPASEDQAVHTFNANFVMLTLGVIRDSGGLDSGFTHHYGDWDLGLRWTKGGGKVIQAPGLVGSTTRERPSPGYKNASLRRIERFKDIASPKAIPLAEQVRFMRRHSGIWPIQVLWPYLKYGAMILIGR